MKRRGCQSSASLAKFAVLLRLAPGIHLVRTNPELSKKALSKYMRSTDPKELEESYQLLKSLIPIKPYPTLEGFKTVFAELAEKVPAQKPRIRKTSSIPGS